MIQLSGEDILFGLSKSGKFKVVSEPKINSKVNLEDYVKRAQQRRSIAAQMGGKIFAAVTVRTPLAFERITELEKRHALGIIFVKIRSSNGGTVFSRWPPDQQWLESLQQNLSVELKERSGIEDFKLVTGVIALYALGEVKDLEELQNESDVYLVDVGPVDVAEQYRDGKETTVKVSDIYYYLEKFS